MISKFRIVVMVLLAAIHAVAAEPQPTVTTRLAGKGDVWVGQQVALQVELAVPGYFSGVPMFDLPQVPGALVIPPSGSPVLSSDEREGVEYTHELFNFTVFPKRAGTMEVPAFEIRIGFKRSPIDSEIVTATVKTEAIRLTAKTPPGSEAGEDVLSSVDLTVSESWKPEPGEKSKPGDAFVRTIRWSASDVPGMGFPPLRRPSIAGLAIYPGEPLVESTSERGMDHDSRTDTVTYVCKTGGDFLIPEKVVRWWDPKKEVMQEVRFPARHLRVIAPPPPPESWKERAGRWLHHYGLTAGVALLLAAALGIAAWHFRNELVRFARRFLPRHLEPLNPRLPVSSDLG